MSSMVKGSVSVQGDLVFPHGWGGRRKGSGRKPLGAKAQVPHGRGQTFRGRKPVHITIPLVREFGVLKRKGVFEIVRRALLGQSQFAGVRSRTPCRAGDALVQEFVVMTDHVHVLVDAADADAVSRVVKRWGGRVAWAMRAKRAAQGPRSERSLFPRPEGAAARFQAQRGRPCGQQHPPRRKHRSVPSGDRWEPAVYKRPA